MRPQCRDLGVGGAAGEVVVDHAHGLHEGVDGGRPDERPAPPLEGAAQRGRFGRGGRDVSDGGPEVGGGFEPPQVGGQRPELPGKF